jgi:starch phosphorylase
MSPPSSVADLNPTAIVAPGAADLAAAAAALAARVPEPLAPLARLAYNYRWSWTPGAADLYAEIDPARWDAVLANPVRLLQEAPAAALERVAADDGHRARLAAVEEEVAADLARPPLQAAVTPERPAAFFCAEYGVHGSLPIYSGGLGVLAGDILKEASDRAVPLVSIGLMYRHGYFRQRIDASGYQHEYWVDTDPDRVPAALVRGEDGEPVTVTVPIADRAVVAQVWRVDVGRVPLLLLDAERPENDPVDRWITSRLYVGDPDLRLAQYLLLGVGGVRALRAVGVEPGVMHLNEGHAAFAALEVARAAHAERGTSLEEAFAVARERTVFTTHTPVPAGNDTYPGEQITHALSGLAAELGVDPGEIVRRGRTRPEDEYELFGVTQFALRSSRAANGVSRRHGEVARGMWHGLHPDRRAEDVPIGHVTNGVHIPTWIGTPMRELLARHLGEDWLRRASDPALWEAARELPADELWVARREQRAALVDLVRRRSLTDRLQRGDGPDRVRAAADAFDPDVLTIGFARRLATYKRLDLLLRDAERALSILRRHDQPIQIVLAGKAHPRDEGGKGLVQTLFAMKGDPDVARRVVFLDDYDMRSAATMVRGCDVWVNLPRPPLEASGTSGMKSAINGGLQLSVLDGWWPEAYDGTNGWAISGAVEEDHGGQDWRHAGELYDALVSEVVPTFYERGADGLPARWLDMVRAALRTVSPAFGAGRMVDEYVERIYPGR